MDSSAMQEVSFTASVVRKIHLGTNVGKGEDEHVIRKVNGVVKYERLGKDTAKKCPFTHRRNEKIPGMGILFLSRITEGDKEVPECL